MQNMNSKAKDGRENAHLTGLPIRCCFGLVGGLYWSGAYPETEEEFLQLEAGALERRLSGIKRRLGELTDADKRVH